MIEEIITIRVIEATLKMKKNTIFRNVNIEAYRGEILGITGKNGVGKTMLLRCIVGILPLTTGKIFINGKILKKEMAFSPNTAYVIEPAGFLSSYNAYDNLRFLTSLQREVSKIELADVLQSVGIKPSDKEKVGVFSKGMLKRLNIAQIILSKPQIILFDDLLDDLDQEGIIYIKKYLRSFANKGGTAIVTSRYNTAIDDICDQIIEMKKE